MTIDLTGGAEARTGVSHANFTRICGAKLDRFTIDLMTILELGQQLDLQIEMHPWPSAGEVSASF